MARAPSCGTGWRASSGSAIQRHRRLGLHGRDHLARRRRPSPAAAAAPGSARRIPSLAARWRRSWYRALDLPWTSQDFFTDDEGLVHEGAINRVAQAGIATGCSETAYCPADAVTRGQMATFLSRALDAAGAEHRLLQRRQRDGSRGRHQPHRRGRHHPRLLGDPLLPRWHRQPPADGCLPVPRPGALGAASAPIGSPARPDRPIAASGRDRYRRPVLISPYRRSETVAPHRRPSRTARRDQRPHLDRHALSRHAGAGRGSRRERIRQHGQRPSRRCRPRSGCVSRQSSTRSRSSAGGRSRAAGEIGHDFDYLQRRFAEEGICWRGFGEIVAVQRQRRLRDVRDPVVNSTAHRNIMLGDYTHAGGSREQRRRPLVRGHDLRQAVRRRTTAGHLRRVHRHRGLEVPRRHRVAGRTGHHRRVPPNAVLPRRAWSLATRWRRS